MSTPIIPVWRTVVADLDTPVSAFLKVRGDGPAFLLESVEHGDRWGRYSFIGIDPFETMVRRGGENSPQDSPQDSPLEEFRDLMGRYSVPDTDGLPPFFAGAVGYLGYDVARYLEDLPQTTKDEAGAPEVLMMCPSVVLVFDHLRQRMTVVVNVIDEASVDAAEDRIDQVVEQLSTPLSQSTLDMVDVQDIELPASSMSREDFEKAVLSAKEYILAGDVFQVVLSHCFSMPLVGDPFDVYRVLRLINPSPYMFFLSHPEVTVFGSSPEPLVKVKGRTVIQRPIAGTRPRGQSEQDDLAIEAEFVTDEKERAEHVMLVDLARNDIGRVSRYGTVKVEELMTVERYSHVMHLVSQVSGELDPAFNSLDALYASFPAGTVSGAPKIRAMQIIDELEPTRRGPYAGVVGYFDFSGDIDTCIALRTAYVCDGVVYIQAGAGIVADSDATAEYVETVNKAKALLSAVQMGF
ncbi:MAG: anthranilate synthase component I [Actinomycetota bacterium]